MRWLRNIVLVFVGFCAVAVLCVGTLYLVNRPSADVRAYMQVRYGSGFDLSEQDRLDKDAATRQQRAERCLEVAARYPGTIGGISALLLASSRAPGTAAGKEATRQLSQQIRTADLDKLAGALDRNAVTQWGKIRDLAPALLARARQLPNHARAGRLLAAVCAMTRPSEDEKPPLIYADAADLIADQQAASPDIVHFSEGLRSGAPWTAPYERHLRSVLKVNRDRFVRCSSLFALACVAQSTSEDRQDEAKSLFEQFLAEFDGTFAYRAQSIEQQYGQLAEDQLNELQTRALGKAAPEIEGFDLDDKPMKLSEYRGRVVLLNFWGTWCYPCMKLIPHERQLVKTFQGQPFAIVGVNCDEDLTKARTAVVENEMTWRSFRDQVKQQSMITTKWQVVGYPALYLIDHHGTIRRRWIGAPALEELNHMTRVLVDAARANVPPHEMRAVMAANPFRARAAAADASERVAPDSEANFLEKVYRTARGDEAKYAIFVPKNYDPAKAWPAILYLHGSGSRGTDGRLPIKHGLAKAIRARSDDFPWIVIFPQAREGESFKVESEGGQRALAILDQVQRDYHIDAHRITLSGVSMGGEGTWSLGAADPKRWAAIVPVCHGADARLAAQLATIPCWCFHGDADKMIPARQSRDMIQAIKDAGGRPLYKEFVGVGHDESADRTYEQPELYEWILRQNTANR